MSDRLRILHPSNQASMEPDLERSASFDSNPALFPTTESAELRGKYVLELLAECQRAYEAGAYQYARELQKDELVQQETLHALGLEGTVWQLEGKLEEAQFCYKRQLEMYTQTLALPSMTSDAFLSIPLFVRMNFTALLFELLLCESKRADTREETACSVLGTSIALACLSPYDIELPSKRSSPRLVQLAFLFCQSLIVKGHEIQLSDLSISQSHTIPVLSDKLLDYGDISVDSAHIVQNPHIVFKNMQQQVVYYEEKGLFKLALEITHIFCHISYILLYSAQYSASKYQSTAITQLHQLFFIKTKNNLLSTNLLNGIHLALQDYNQPCAVNLLLAQTHLEDYTDKSGVGKIEKILLNWNNPTIGLPGNLQVCLSFPESAHWTYHAFFTVLGRVILAYQTENLYSSDIQGLYFQQIKNVPLGDRQPNLVSFLKGILRLQDGTCPSSLITARALTLFDLGMLLQDVELMYDSLNIQEQGAVQDSSSIELANSSMVLEQRGKYRKALLELGGDQSSSNVGEKMERSILMLQSDPLYTVALSNDKIMPFSDHNNTAGNEQFLFMPKASAAGTLSVVNPLRCLAPFVPRYCNYKGLAVQHQRYKTDFKCRTAVNKDNQSEHLPFAYFMQLDGTLDPPLHNLHTPLLLLTLSITQELTVRHGYSGSLELFKAGLCRVLGMLPQALGHLVVMRQRGLQGYSMITQNPTFLIDPNSCISFCVPFQSAVMTLSEPHHVRNTILLSQSVVTKGSDTVALHPSSLLPSSYLHPSTYVFLVTKVALQYYQALLYMPDVNTQWMAVYGALDCWRVLLDDPATEHIHPYQFHIDLRDSVPGQDVQGPGNVVFTYESVNDKSATTTAMDAPCFSACSTTDIAQILAQYAQISVHHCTPEYTAQLYVLLTQLFLACGLQNAATTSALHGLYHQCHARIAVGWGAATAQAWHKLSYDLVFDHHTHAPRPSLSESSQCLQDLLPEKDAWHALVPYSALEPLFLLHSAKHPVQSAAMLLTRCLSVCSVPSVAGTSVTKQLNAILPSQPTAPPNMTTAILSFPRVHTCFLLRRHAATLLSCLASVFYLTARTPSQLLQMDRATCIDPFNPTLLQLRLQHSRVRETPSNTQKIVSVMLKTNPYTANTTIATMPLSNIPCSASTAWYKYTIVLSVLLQPTSLGAALTPAALATEYANHVRIRSLVTSPFLSLVPTSSALASLSVSLPRVTLGKQHTLVFSHAYTTCQTRIPNCLHFSTGSVLLPQLPTGTKTSPISPFLHLEHALASLHHQFSQYRHPLLNQPHRLAYPLEITVYSAPWAYQRSLGVSEESLMFKKTAVIQNSFVSPYAMSPWYAYGDPASIMTDSPRTHLPEASEDALYPFMHTPAVTMDAACCKHHQKGLQRGVGLQQGSGLGEGGISENGGFLFTRKTNPMDVLTVLLPHTRTYLYTICQHVTLNTQVAEPEHLSVYGASSIPSLPPATALTEAERKFSHSDIPAYVTYLLLTMSALGKGAASRPPVQTELMTVLESKMRKKNNLKLYQLQSPQIASTLPRAMAAQAKQYIFAQPRRLGDAMHVLHLLLQIHKTSEATLLLGLCFQELGNLHSAQDAFLATVTLVHAEMTATLPPLSRIKTQGDISLFRSLHLRQEQALQMVAREQQRQGRFSEATLSLHAMCAKYKLPSEIDYPVSGLHLEGQLETVRCCCQLADYDGAITALNEFQFYKNDPRHFPKLIFCFLLAHRFKDAQELVVKMQKTYPNNPSLVLAESALLYCQGQYSACLSFVKEHLITHRGYTELHYLEAKCLEKLYLVVPALRKQYDIIRNAGLSEFSRVANTVHNSIPYLWYAYMLALQSEHDGAQDLYLPTTNAVGRQLEFGLRWDDAQAGRRTLAHFDAVMDGIEREDVPARAANRAVLTSLHLLLQSNPGAKGLALAAYMHRANHGSGGMQETAALWVKRALEMNPNNLLALAIACLQFLQQGDLVQAQSSASSVLLALNSQKALTDRSKALADRGNQTSVDDSRHQISPLSQFASLVLGYCLYEAGRHSRAAKVFDACRYIADQPLHTDSNSALSHFHSLQSTISVAYSALSWGGSALLHLRSAEASVSNALIESGLRCLDGAHLSSITTALLQRTRLWLYLLQTQGSSQVGQFHCARTAVQKTLTLGQAELQLASQDEYSSWQQFSNLRGGMLATAQGCQHALLAQKFVPNTTRLKNPVPNVEWLGLAAPMLASQVTALLPVLRAKEPSKKHLLRTATENPPTIFSPSGINGQVLCALNNVMGVLLFMEYRYTLNNNIFVVPHISTLKKKTYTLDAVENLPLKTELKDIMSFFARSRNAYNLVVLLIQCGNYQEALSVLHSTILSTGSAASAVDEIDSDGNLMQSPFIDPTPIRNTHDVRTSPLVHLQYGLCASSQQEHNLAISHFNTALESVLKITRKLSQNSTKSASEGRQKHWIMILTTVHVALGTEYAHTVAYSQALHHYNQAALLLMRHCNVLGVLGGKDNNKDSNGSNNSKEQKTEEVDIFMVSTQSNDSPLQMRTDTVKILISTVLCNSAVCKFNLGFRAAAARELGLSHPALLNICPTETLCFILLSCGDVCKAIELLTASIHQLSMQLTALGKKNNGNDIEEERKLAQFRLSNLSSNLQFCVNTRNQAVTLCSEVASGTALLLTMTNQYCNSLYLQPQSKVEPMHWQHLLDSVHIVYTPSAYRMPRHYPANYPTLPILAFIPEHVPVETLAVMLRNELPRWHATFARMSIQLQQATQRALKSQMDRFHKNNSNPPPPRMREHCGLLRAMTLKLPGTFDGMRVASLGTMEQLAVHHLHLLLENLQRQLFVLNDDQCTMDQKHVFAQKRFKTLLDVYIVGIKQARLAQLAGRYIDVLKHLHGIVREGMIYHHGCVCMQSLLQTAQRIVALWAADVIGFLSFNGNMQYDKFPRDNDVDLTDMLAVLPIFIAHSTSVLQIDPQNVAARKMSSRSQSGKSRKNLSAAHEAWMVLHYLKYSTEWELSGHDVYSALSKFNKTGDKTTGNATRTALNPSAALDALTQSIGGSGPTEDWGLGGNMATLPQHVLFSLQKPVLAAQQALDSALQVSLASVYIWKDDLLKAGDALLVAILLNPLNTQAVFCRGHLALLHCKYVDFCTHTRHLLDTVLWNQHMIQLRSNDLALQQTAEQLPSLFDVLNTNTRAKSTSRVLSAGARDFTSEMDTFPPGCTSHDHKLPCAFSTQDGRTKCLDVLKHRKDHKDDDGNKLRNVCETLELIMTHVTKLYEVTESKKSTGTVNTTNSNHDLFHEHSTVNITQLRTLLTHETYDLHLLRLAATNDTNMRDEHTIMRTVTATLKSTMKNGEEAAAATIVATHTVNNNHNNLATDNTVDELDQDIIEAMSMKHLHTPTNTTYSIPDTLLTNQSAFDVFVNN